MTVLSVSGGRAIELSQSIYHGDTHDFVAELNAS
jgi:DNA-binding GntR family transcriptional regulator